MYSPTHFHCENPLPIPDCFEIIAIPVQLNSKRLLIITVYRSPSTLAPETRAMFQFLEELLLDFPEGDVFIMGDLNINESTDKTNSNLRNL